ncbi:MAG TPA: hypothetical protein VM261_16360 [Kofleriaceae bacterium]|nr:hypothetical protein [Kofleriaceae bacterium]
MTPEYPFFFYGAAPTEWYGGGRLDYEVRFAATPTTAERGRLAELVRTELAAKQEIRLDAHDRWHWADAWTRLVIRTRTMEPDWNSFFDEVGVFFRALHAVCAVELVVCRSVDTVKGTDDPWTAWSLAQRPEIGARPSWGGTRASHDRFAWQGPALPIDASFDADFEAARVLASPAK